MQNIQSVAKRIKEFCDTQKVTINKMLTDSGAGARTYYNMLAGSYPSTDKMEKIADYFNCSVDYLLGRTDNPEINRLPINKNIVNLQNKYEDDQDYELIAFHTRKHIITEDDDDVD